MGGMKKLVLLGIMACLIVSCGSDKKEASKQASTTTTTLPKVTHEKDETHLLEVLPTLEDQPAGYVQNFRQASKIEKLEGQKCDGVEYVVNVVPMVSDVQAGFEQKGEGSVSGEEQTQYDISSFNTEKDAQKFMGLAQENLGKCASKVYKWNDDYDYKESLASAGKIKNADECFGITKTLISDGEDAAAYNEVICRRGRYTLSVMKKDISDAATEANTLILKL